MAALPMERKFAPILATDITGHSYPMGMDTKTRLVIACYGSDRNHTSAEPLWARMPAAYCEPATCSTDQYEAHTGVMLVAQNTAIAKKARKN